MSAVTFEVSPVETPRRPLRELRRDAIASSLSRTGRIEQAFESTARLVGGAELHPFVQAARHAFYLHYPLTLTPDGVWFCIAQGFAHHVRLHAETLRRAFVAHEGQLTLVVERRDFLLGKPNPWPEAFSAFSQQIAQHVGPLHRVVVADFSTTGPVERAASEVLLMDVFEPYFEYAMMLGCGIPAITLAGTPDDWRSIRKRAAVFAEYGLQDWLATLLPVLDKLVETASGRPDIAFWRSFFRHQSNSGPNELTGWINALFPYLRAKPRSDGSGFVWNRYMGAWQEALREAQARPESLPWWDPVGPAEHEIPSPWSSVPVKTTDIDTGAVTHLRFVGGLFGVAQDPASLALCPSFGWAVVHAAAGVGRS